MSEILRPIRVGRHELGIPVFQGGMSIRISGSELAAEVSKFNAAGTIGGVGRGFARSGYEHLPFRQADRQALSDDLQRALEINPRGIIGVNLLVAVADYDNLVRVAATGGAKFIVSGAGLPLNLPTLTADYPDVALIPIVSSLQATRIICKRWQKKHNRLPDAIVVEEPATAGGHLGITPKQQINDPKLRLEVVIPEIKRFLQNLNLDIPLIAAGGIWDRPDIDHMLELGANGVQMATRFVTTSACQAPDAFKQKYLDSTPADIVTIRSPVGIPGRAIRTNFTDKAERGEIHHNPCRYYCLHNCRFRETEQTYCIVEALSNACRGYIEDSIVFAGSNAPRAKEQGIVSVRQIFDELTSN